jgi:two-component system sensor histidine kinase PilS (NtrC family)
MSVAGWSMGEPPYTDWAALDAQGSGSSALLRLRRGFLLARCCVGVVVMLLQLVTFALGQPGHWIASAVALAYLAAALAGLRWAPVQLPMRALGPAWVVTIGIDLATFATLHVLQAGSIDYTPLFAMPVLMGAVLGTVSVGLGTTAAVSLLLLADAGWRWLAAQPSDSPTRFLQAALTSTGLFLVVLLAHELSRRLAREEARAQRSRSTAQVQARVNDLVIETLSEGVLVIDVEGRVHAANPAADAILGQGLAGLAVPFALGAHPAWGTLAEISERTFAHHAPQTHEIPVAQPRGAAREVRVRTRLTPVSGLSGNSLCVMFLQDLRELEARIRTEKLAAMGRMSAAVAHEIRNPLAAITQASALLDEDLSDPGQRQLLALVAQNARRLSRIVDDVLDVARVREQRVPPPGEQIPLDATVHTLAGEWMRQTQCAGLRLSLEAPGRQVMFDAEHLRRILVNLLDNAMRYASDRPDSIRIATRAGPRGDASLRVWSDGAPLEPAVQRHLFEPFFSSESRSSGLGLFLCRELCARHGATIGYERCPAAAADGPEGNEFRVGFADAPPPRAGRLTQSAT